MWVTKWSLKIQQWLNGCVKFKGLIVETSLGGHVFLSQDSSWYIINSSQWETRNGESQGSKSEGVKALTVPWCAGKLEQPAWESGEG